MDLQGRKHVRNLPLFFPKSKPTLPEPLLDRASFAYRPACLCSGRPHLSSWPALYQSTGRLSSPTLLSSVWVTSTVVSLPPYISFSKSACRFLTKLFFQMNLKWTGGFFLLKSSFGSLKELNKRCQLTELSVASRYRVSCKQGPYLGPAYHWWSRDTLLLLLPS